jgi:hypothetical protein
MIDAVIQRLEAKVPDIAGRIQGAAELADLMRNNRLPRQTPAAHVVPVGLRGGAPSASAGFYVQELSETVGVVLTLRSHDATGARALTQVDQLIRAVADAIAGWAPGAETGVFRLERGRLASMSAGTLVYQIDFTITDQLRITP